MFELGNMFRKQLQYLLFLISIYILCWGITDWKTIFAGLILGTAVGILNLWTMVTKTIKFGEAAVTGKKAKSLGTFTRMALAVLAAAIAMRYPEQFSIVAVVIGLMTIYVVVMLDFAIRNYKDSRKKER